MNIKVEWVPIDRMSYLTVTEVLYDSGLLIVDENDNTDGVHEIAFRIKGAATQLIKSVSQNEAGDRVRTYFIAKIITTE